MFRLVPVCVCVRENDREIENIYTLCMYVCVCLHFWSGYYFVLPCYWGCYHKKTRTNAGEQTSCRWLCLLRAIIYYLHETLRQLPPLTSLYNADISWSAPECSQQLCVCLCVCVCVCERESEHMHLFWDPRSAAFQAMVLGGRIELGEVPIFQFCFEFPATQILSVSYHIYNSIYH